MSNDAVAKAPLSTSASSFGLGADEDPISLIQTHIGWIYVSRSFAFKLKKHVKFDFLDFTTIEKRRWACEREIALNSRLCPNIYLGLCPVYRDASGNIFLQRDASASAGSGEVVDWAVWMRRMPLDRMLDALLEKGSVTPRDAEVIAEALAGFHTSGRGKIAAGGLGDLDSVRANVEGNIRDVSKIDSGVLAPEALQLLTMRSRHFMDRHGDVIRKRAADGFVVDGHGDLRAENICLPKDGPPLLFDCIEFNDHFRVLDGALDAAFLAMDFDSRGRVDLSAAFMQRYRDLCDPQLPPALFNFYLGYRAFIKGKVTAWIAADPHVPAQQKEFSRKQSRTLFDLAVQYAIKGKPIVVLFCGVAGSGKSSLARSLAERLRCESHVATDFVRDEIVPRGAPLGERYMPAVSQRVYEILYERMVKALHEKRIVILDGTFTRAENRARVAKLARDHGACAVLLWADASAETIAAHVQKRNETGDVFGSEATITIAREQLANFETPGADSGFQAVCRIDTNGKLDDAREDAWRQAIGALSWHGRPAHAVPLSPKSRRGFNP